ncbi:hypothetical protein GCM10007940_36660 [Portibacter lacus]|uniref:Receptor L-domain domain-containing protein n=2 Tax=Portibacter lacus TaxID=1099794 RepID=A0AA37WHS3_9BACT|nr:hypothetical protein GCM10007940_36660 [Portibacter lacus]
MEGNVMINGISSIEELRNIEVILGDLKIENLELEEHNTYFSLPSLKQVAGNLLIRNINSPATVFLDSLLEVKSIVIENNDSLEFVSLRRLESVQGHLSLKNNNVIGSLNIETVANLKMNAVEIKNNPKLYAFFPPNIDEIDSIEIIDNRGLRMLAWPSLVKINRHIDISNSVTQGVSQFPNLEIVGNYVRLENIPLGAFIKFENLRIIGTGNKESDSGLIISDIAKLHSIELPELVDINGELSIINTQNSHFVAVKMPKLEQINSLKIVNNAHFEDLDFLRSIKSISDSVVIKGNEKLSSCRLPFICSLDDNVLENQLTIANNLDCCVDIKSLREECEEKCCPDSSTYIFDQCDVFIYKTDAGECYEINIDANGKPQLKKVSCPD